MVFKLPIQVHALVRFPRAVLRIINRGMPDPFKLFGRMFVSAVVITGYFIVFLAQTVWLIAFRQTDRIADAFGYLGRKVADEFAGIFR